LEVGALSQFDVAVAGSDAGADDLQLGAGRYRLARNRVGIARRRCRPLARDWHDDVALTCDLEREARRISNRVRCGAASEVDAKGEDRSWRTIDRVGARKIDRIGRRINRIGRRIDGIGWGINRIGGNGRAVADKAENDRDARSRGFCPDRDARRGIIAGDRDGRALGQFNGGIAFCDRHDEIDPCAASNLALVFIEIDDGSETAASAYAIFSFEACEPFGCGALEAVCQRNLISGSTVLPDTGRAAWTRKANLTLNAYLARRARGSDLGFIDSSGDSRAASQLNRNRGRGRCDGNGHR